MVTYFITVLNGVITGHHCGDINADFFKTAYYGHERIVVPPNVSVREFDRVDFYDENWKRKSVLRLIDEELIPMPEGYVMEGDELRPMTGEERVIAGLDEPPAGYKIENGTIVEMSPVERINAGVDELPQGCKIENGEIIPMTRVERITDGLEELPPGYKIVSDELVHMTLPEQLEAGQISQDEYEQHLATESTAELQRRLAELQTPEALAQAELDENYAAERKTKLAALLAVKTQSGWPLVVEWPE